MVTLAPVLVIPRNVQATNRQGPREQSAVQMMVRVTEKAFKTELDSRLPPYAS